MNQNQANQANQANVDNDLQKAIDDITNTTSSDPVFSDPVAAPSSIPEGDTGELSAPVGPFPEPAPEPSLDMAAPEPAPEPKLEMVAPAPEPIAPLDAMSAVPELTMPVPEPAPEFTTPESIPHNLTTSEIKKAALRDLAPLLDKVHMEPSQKFDTYCRIFEDLKDYSVLDPAYQAARDIPDDTARAEALLYLIQSIDKM